MTRDTDKKRPVILTDYFLRLPILSDKRDIPATIGLYGFLICSILLFVTIWVVDNNKIALIVIFSLSILFAIYGAIFSKSDDFIGEVQLDKQQITIKLNSGNPLTFQLSDVILKLKYYSYDGKNNFPSRIIGNGLGNIIEIKTGGDKYSYQVYFTIYDVRTLNLYADIWDQNHYDYSFTGNWGMKVKRLSQ